MKKKLLFVACFLIFFCFSYAQTAITYYNLARSKVKLQDYKGAIATAEQSMTIAKDEKNDNYIKLNEKLIAEAKKEGK